MDVHFTGHGAATRPLPAARRHTPPPPADGRRPVTGSRYAGLCRLHSSDTDTDGWTDRLFGTRAPTFEFRLQRPAGLTPISPSMPEVLTRPQQRYTKGYAPRVRTSTNLHRRHRSHPQRSRRRLPDGGDIPLAAVEWVGDAERRDDWQTQLTPFAVFQATDDTRLPLAVIAEALTDTTAAVTYQVVCRRYRDWRGDARARQQQLEAGRDTPASRVVDDLVGDVLADTAPKNGSPKTSLIRRRLAARGDRRGRPSIRIS